MYMISNILFIIHPFKALRYEFLYHNSDDTDGYSILIHSILNSS